MKTVTSVKKHCLVGHSLFTEGKIRWIILLLILTVTLQESRSQGIRFGISVEPHITWMNSDSKSVQKDGSRAGINFGLIVDKYFAENYAFSTGIHLNHVGGKLNYNDMISFRNEDGTDTIPAGSTVNYKLQYVNLPIGLKLKTDEIGYLTFFAQLGINPQINIKAVADIDNTDFSDTKINEEINLFNLGYHIGLGIEYSLGGNTALFLAVLYNHLFLDITIDHSDQPKDRAVLDNIAVRIGINF